MSNFVIFVVGVGVTLVAGMGVITSQVFLGYKPLKREQFVSPKESFQNI